jgi:hypothetical protein
MQKGLGSMPLTITISASGATAKRVPYVAVSEAVQLICGSDSEQQCVSGDSDAAAADGLSEDSNKCVRTDQMWCGSSSEDGAIMHPSSAPRPGANRRAAPHITADSSPLDCFSLTFTDGLLNVIWYSPVVTASNTFKGRTTKLNNQTLLLRKCIVLWL